MHWTQHVAYILTNGVDVVLGLSPVCRIGGADSGLKTA